MIPIRHSYYIPKYDQFLEEFQKRIVSWLDGTDKKLSHKSQELAKLLYIRQRFSLFKKLNFIRWIAYTPANRLELLINNLEILFKCGLSEEETNNMAEALNIVFCHWGFDNKTFPKYALVEDTGVKCCPYCNRNFTVQYRYRNYQKQVDGKAQPELDHFYSKSSYPYLAICCNNLVPCCNNCNGVHGKWNKDARIANLINPYELENADGIQFRVDVESGAFLSMSEFEDGASLSVEAIGPYKTQLDNNINIFHLNELYKKHIDYAAEIYYKGRLKYNPYYLSFLKHVLNDKTISKSDKYRLLLGVYTDEKDYGKRPLSKFCTDIAKQFGLI